MSGGKKKKKAEGEGARSGSVRRGMPKGFVALGRNSLEVRGGAVRQRQRSECKKKNRKKKRRSAHLTGNDSNPNDGAREAHGQLRKRL